MECLILCHFLQFVTAIFRHEIFFCARRIGDFSRNNLGEILFLEVVTFTVKWNFSYTSEMHFTDRVIHFMQMIYKKRTFCTNQRSVYFTYEAH